MSENIENKKLINFLLISIVIVGMIVCLLFIYRTVFSDSLDTQGEIDKIVEEKTDPNKPINKYTQAILHYTNYLYSPYDLFKEKTVITSEDFSNVDAIEFILGFENNQEISNILNKTNTLFNKNITEDDLTTDPSFNIYNGKVDVNDSTDSLDLIIHYIYDSKEDGNKLIYREYCAYQHSELNENPNVKYYYNFHFTPGEDGKPINTDEAVFVTDTENQSFNIIDDKDRVSDVEWVFEKGENGSYKLVSIELKN